MTLDLLTGEPRVCQCEDGHGGRQQEGHNVLPPHAHEDGARYQVERPEYEARSMSYGRLTKYGGNLPLCTPCAKFYDEREYRVVKLEES